MIHGSGRHDAPRGPICGVVGYKCAQFVIVRMACLIIEIMPSIGKSFLALKARTHHLKELLRARLSSIAHRMEVFLKSCDPGLN